MVGVPRVQPLNDYRLIFMVKKGLDQYMANNKVRRGCVYTRAACMERMLRLLVSSEHTAARWDNRNAMSLTSTSAELPLSCC